MTPEEKQTERGRVQVAVSANRRDQSPEGKKDEQRKAADRMRGQAQLRRKVLIS